MSFFRPKNFGLIFFLNLYQSSIVITFSQKKCRSFRLFSKSCSKSTVYRLSRFHFFDQPNVFFHLENFGLFLVESLSEHLLWSLSAKKSAGHFEFFRKVARKSTVYRLSRFDFFDQPKDVFVKIFGLLNLYQSSIVITFSQKKCRFSEFFRKVASKSTVYRLSRFHFFEPN